MQILALTLVVWINSFLILTALWKVQDILTDIREILKPTESKTDENS